VYCKSVGVLNLLWLLNRLGQALKLVTEKLVIKMLILRIIIFIQDTNLTVFFVCTIKGYIRSMNNV